MRAKSISTFQFLHAVLMELVKFSVLSSALNLPDHVRREDIEMIWKDKADESHIGFSRTITASDFWEMSDSEMDFLGFRRLGEVRCIPLWAINYIADGELLSVPGDGRTIAKISGDYGIELTPDGVVSDYRGFPYPLAV